MRNLNGHHRSNWHSTPSRRGSWRPLSFRCQTHSSLSWSNQTHLNLHQEQYYGNRTPMEIGTHVAICHSHSTLWNKTMRSTTGNCWPSSRLSQNGATTYLAPPTLSRFIRSQEPHLLPNSTEVEQTTSTLEPIPFRI